MTTSVLHEPSPAERVRTALARALTVVVEIGTVHEVIDVVAVDGDGSLVLLVAAEGPLTDRLVGHLTVCTVHAAMVSPLPGPDRVLDAVTAFGTVRLAGDVGAALDTVIEAHPDRPAELVLRPDASALLRVDVAHLRLNGEPVDPEAYVAAQCDPFAAGSNDVVEHLVKGHPAEVVQLAHLLDPDILRGVYAVAPVRVDRFGFTFRVDSAAGSARTRLNFPAALRGPAELPAAIRELHGRAAQVTTCPFGDGPHSTVPTS